MTILPLQISISFSRFTGSRHPVFFLSLYAERDDVQACELYRTDVPKTSNRAMRLYTRLESTLMQRNTLYLKTYTALKNSFFCQCVQSSHHHHHRRSGSGEGRSSTHFRLLQRHLVAGSGGGAGRRKGQLGRRDVTDDDVMQALEQQVSSRATQDAQGQATRTELWNLCVIIQYFL